MTTSSNMLRIPEGEKKKEEKNESPAQLICVLLMPFHQSPPMTGGC